MGLIGKIFSSFVDFESNLREIITEIYFKYTKQSRHVSPPGIDSAPILGDQGTLIVLDGTSGKSVMIGVYPDPQALPGEVRIYSRNIAGIEQAYSWHKNDGTIELNGNTDFAVAFTDLKTVIQELQNDITTLKSVFSGWTPVAQDGGAALKTAATTWYGTPITENIDTAKVDNVKVK